MASSSLSKSGSLKGRLFQFRNESLKNIYDLFHMDFGDMIGGFRLPRRASWHGIRRRNMIVVDGSDAQMHRRRTAEDSEHRTLNMIVFGNLGWNSEIWGRLENSQEFSGCMYMCKSPNGDGLSDGRSTGIWPKYYLHTAGDRPTVSSRHLPTAVGSKNGWKPVKASGRV